MWQGAPGKKVPENLAVYRARLKALEPYQRAMQAQR